MNTYAMPTIEDQQEECRTWVALFQAAGYESLIEYTPGNGPFDREWQIWTAGGEGKRVGTVYYSGTGAQWAGDDDLWLKIIGPSVGVTR